MAEGHLLTPPKLDISRSASPPPEGYSLSNQGLLSPYTRTDTGIDLPEGVVTATGIILPKKKRYRLFNPEDADILKTAGEGLREKQSRSGSKLALAMADTGLFLLRETEDLHSQDTELVKMAEMLREEVDKEIPKEIPEQTLHRKMITRNYYDRDTRESKKYVITEPGSMEKLGMLVVDIAGKPEFKGTEVPTKGLEAFGNLIKAARLDQEAYTAPEMPDLVSKCTTLLAKSALKGPIREQLYNILEQVDIPESQQEDLIYAMDKNLDLHTPLAYRLSVSLETRPTSKWIDEQADRREKLLELLKAPTQNLFDNYEDLVKLRQGLVYSGDPKEPETGKIGIEVEYWCDTPATKVPKGWESGIDLGGNFEMRKSDDALAHGNNYRGSMYDMAHWFGDNAVSISSLHIHLDKQTHPNESEIKKTLNDADLFRTNPLDTWEVRGLFPPVTGNGNTVSPAVVEDAINLLIYQTKQPQKEGAKIQIADDREDKTGVDKILWGHMCQRCDDPEVRLATLMSLRYDFLLRKANLQRVAASYTTESVLSIADSFDYKKLAWEQKGK